MPSSFGSQTIPKYMALHTDEMSRSLDEFPIVKERKQQQRALTRTQLNEMINR